MGADIILYSSNTKSVNACIACVDGINPTDTSFLVTDNFGNWVGKKQTEIGQGITVLKVFRHQEVACHQNI